MDKKTSRLRRAKRARAKISELGANRLVVHRTPRHIYAQLIAPTGSEVIAAASTLDKEVSAQLKKTGNVEAATAVGKAIAERAVGRAHIPALGTRRPALPWKRCHTVASGW